MASYTRLLQLVSHPIPRLAEPGVPRSRTQTPLSQTGTRGPRGPGNPTCTPARATAFSPTATGPSSWSWPPPACAASEFLNLTQGDINLRTGAVRVQRGKGGAQRMTIISPEARLAVADYLSHLQQRNVKNPRVKSERNLTEAGLFRQGIILPGQAYLL